MVFISYNTEDRVFVRKLAGDLRVYGVDVFWDNWNIKPGESIIQKVEEAIKNSSFLLAVLSKNSIKSRWVQLELSTALLGGLSREIDIKIIPIKIDNCSIPLVLQNIKFIDFRQNHESALQQLLEALGLQAISWKVDWAEEILQQVRASARKRDFSLAEQQCFTILNKLPDYPAALSALANIRFHQQRFQEGINLANRAIRIDPNFPYPYYQRGICRDASGNTDLAIQDLNQALRLKPDFDYAMNRLREIRSRGKL
jgi:tetratricopeptide (TPR) repeat protein